MKNILSIFAIFFSILLFSFSCSKPKTEDKKEKPKPSITLIAPVGGESFAPSELIKISWKSANVSAGSLVVAELVHQVPGSSIFSRYIIPQSKQNIILGESEVSATVNDGQEMFLLPEMSDAVYKGSFGPEYKIKIFILFKNSNGWSTTSPDGVTVQDQSNGFFTILKS